MDNQDRVNRGAFLAVVTLAAVYGLVFSYLGYLKYQAFSYHDWDMAVYASFCHNAWRGNFFSSLLGAPFFGNHLNLLLLPVVPLYALWHSPCTLLVLQAFALAAAALPLYAIAKKSVGPVAAAVCALLFLVHPAVHYTNLNEFHPETFFPVLFFSAFYFMIQGRTVWMLVFAGLCLLLKENLALMIAPLGLYAALAHKNKLGWALMAASTAWFFVAVLFIIPPLNQGIIGYYNIYPGFGDTPGAILKYAALHPVTVLQTMLRPEKMLYVVHLLMPLCFLPLLGAGVAWMAVPILGQHLLSGRPTECSMAYYYSIEILPALFVGSIYGFRILSRFLASPRSRGIALALIGAAALGVSVQTGPFSADRATINRREFTMDYLDLERARLTRAVPPDAPVAATFEFLPRLSARKELYSFHYAYTGHSILSKTPYELPDSVEYALVDFDDVVTFKGFYAAEGWRKIRRLLTQRRLEPIDFVETLVLFGHRGPTEPRLVEMLETMPEAEIQHATRARVAEDIELAGYTVRKTGRKDLVELVFYWKCLKATARDVTLCLDLVGPDGATLARKFHPIGYRIYPTNSWTPGQVLKESARFVVPSAESGLSWEFRASFVDDAAGQPCGIAGVTGLDARQRMALPLHE